MEDALPGEKTRGEQHYQGKLKHGRTSKSGRSRFAWGKMDKVRHVRRVADRHSHHRRRSHVRRMEAHDQLEGLESMPAPSSTGRQAKHKSRGQRSENISNRKRM